MRELIKKTVDTPWKAFGEIAMFLFKISAFVSFVIIKKVQLGQGHKFYGLPKILRHRGSVIEIGDNFENRNRWDSNPLGINHPTIFCTWLKGAKILIGDDVGISGGSIVASKRIEIGDGTLIGANCTIIDTDFHPITSKARRYGQEAIKSNPVKIGKNVFIGMDTTMLKGVIIPDDTVIPAGSTVVASKNGGYRLR